MTNRLTVERSTTELLRNMIVNEIKFIITKFFYSFQARERIYPEKFNKRYYKFLTEP